jgi:signal peptidase I
VIAVIGPWGIGHYYLGRTRRALLWLLVPSAVFALGVILMPAVGDLVGFGTAFFVLFGGIALAWIASLVDLRFTPVMRSPGAAKVFGYWILGAVLSVAVRLPLRAVVLEAFKTPSGSMSPTLLPGDHIMADKLGPRTRGARRGEVMVFRYPEKPDQEFVKRVIAVGGDVLEVEGGHPRINGWPVPSCKVGDGSLDGDSDPVPAEIFVEFLEGEAYLVAITKSEWTSHATQGPYVVPAGEAWVLGDNRNNSHDSRMWFGGRGGGVPRDNLRGRALFRWLTLTPRGIDWSRVGTSLRDPLLPDSLAPLAGGLKRCLSARPTRAETIPPTPRQ